MTNNTPRASDWQAAAELPPITRIGPLAWVMANLFGSWFNSLLTLVVLALMVVVGRAIFHFFQQSEWQVVTQNLTLFAIGQYPREQGWRPLAALEMVWALVGASALLWGRRSALSYVVAGSYVLWAAYGLAAGPAGDPSAALSMAFHRGWQIALAAIVVAAGIGTLLRPEGRWPRRVVLGAWIASPVLTTLILSGIDSGSFVLWLTPLTLAILAEIVILLLYWLLRSRLPGFRRRLAWIVAVPVLFWVVFAFVVPRSLVQRTGIEFMLPPVLTATLPGVRTQLWSGLLLTLFLTVSGIVGSFPLGLLLALGRRSNLIILKTLCTIYIETFRGVPLVTILFMAQVMLPLFVGASVDVVIRAMIGTMIFSAAYLAENVRGGLQAIPKGQVEAAEALGLSAPLVTGLIVLPQAIRIVIPAIVGQFISLFKDTTLVSIITLLDLLGIAKAALAQAPVFQFHKTEVYLFIAAIYFVFSYVMSSAARRIETATSGMGGTSRI